MNEIRDCSNCGRGPGVTFVIVDGKAVCLPCYGLKPSTVSVTSPEPVPTPGRDALIEDYRADVDKLNARIAELEAEQVEGQAAVAKRMSTYDAILADFKAIAEELEPQGWHLDTVDTHVDGSVRIDGSAGPVPRTWIEHGRTTSSVTMRFIAECGVDGDLRKGTLHCRDFPRTLIGRYSCWSGDTTYENVGRGYGVMRMRIGVLTVTAEEFMPRT